MGTPEGVQYSSPSTCLLCGGQPQAVSGPDGTVVVRCSRGFSPEHDHRFAVRGRSQPDAWRRWNEFALRRPPDPKLLSDCVIMLQSMTHCDDWNAHTRLLARLQREVLGRAETPAAEAYGRAMRAVSEWGEAIKKNPARAVKQWTALSMSMSDIFLMVSGALEKDDQ